MTTCYPLLSSILLLLLVLLLLLLLLSLMMIIIHIIVIFVVVFTIPAQAPYIKDILLISLPSCRLDFRYSPW